MTPMAERMVSGNAAAPTAKLFSLADARADASTDIIVPSVAPAAVTPPEPIVADVSSPGMANNSRWQGVLLCLNVACLTATVSLGAMIAASLQPWQTLQSMSEKLGSIEGAEDRLRTDIVGAASRIDGVIQLRMDRFDARQYEFLEGLGSLRASVEDTAETVRDGGTRVDDRLSAMLVSIADLTAPDRTPASPQRSGPRTVAAILPASLEVPDGVPSPTRSPGAALKASSRFERREMPDGSVAYRRVD